MPLHTDIIGVRNGHVILVGQDKKDATPEQWTQALAHIQQALTAENGNMARVAGLVISDGGAPNVEQRASMKELLAGRPFRVCVSTDLAVVRVVVGIMSWFNREMHVVPPHDLKGWFNQGRVAPNEYDQVWKAMWKLQLKLGGLTTAGKMNTAMQGSARSTA